MEESTQKIFKTIFSDTQGDFEFKNTLPGHYLVKASHPEWILSSSETKITVESDSQSILSGLVILGYPVQGQVFSEGEPIQNVIFTLYSERSNDATSNCGLNAPLESTSVEKHENWELVCQTSSDLKGHFVFPVVQPGRYKLVPLYQGENIRFDITPAAVEFEVEDTKLIMSQKFEVFFS